MTSAANRPTEHKTVQSRILHYAQEIGWRYVPRDEAEKRRGFTPHPSPLPQGEREDADEARRASRYFGDLLRPLMMTRIRDHDLDLVGLESKAN